MTRRTRPAVNPNTSHSVITAKAHLCGWDIKTSPAADETSELILTRDEWKIVVALRAGTAFAAAIQYPGRPNPSAVVGSDQMTRYLRGHREQMSAFRIGQRVIVGEQAGVVEDIIPDDEVKVRLVVHYDDGSAGEPYTTHVRAEEEVTV
ncbi:hypothetical protein ACQEVF_59380 [Nonomuraea polychroma]|uniref:hypothetical protein n=1 Tax=Nonomuraea polychroma TaxID=46176 RepID=UPI003D946F21